jgi:hypothetical protein
MNLVDLIKGQMNDDVIGKLGSLIGESPDKARSAVNAAVPTLLGSLAGMASSGDGAQKLMSVLDQQEPGLLGNFASMLGSGGNNLAEKGSAMMSSLFGGSMVTSVLGVLAKFLNIDAAKIGKLIAAVAPMVMGVLASQKKSLGLNASGLAQMLAGQKQNISAAMPSGLASALSAVPGLGSMADFAKSGMSAAASYGQQGMNAAAQAANPLRWLLPLLVLAVAGYFGWQYWQNQQKKAPVADAAKGLLDAAGVTKLTNDVKSWFTNATDALNGIKDEATATEALPKLKDMVGQLDGWKAMLDKVPAAAKGGLTTLLKDSLKSLTEVVNKVLAMPVVGDQLKPVLTELTTKLTNLVG